MRRHSILVALAALLAIVSGCGDDGHGRDDAPVTHDAAVVDTETPDAALDTPAIDARFDSADIDAPPDAANDAPPDAALDAVPDAALDAVPDAAIDAVPDAALDAAPGTVLLQLVGANAVDEVAVLVNGLYPTQFCAGGSPCTIVVAPTDTLELIATTADATSVDWSFPCTGYDCGIAAPAAGTVTVTFHHVTGEQAAVFPDEVYSVDFDASGDLLVGTAGGVYALAPDLSTLWSAPIGGFARWTAAGDAYVVDSGTITKVAPTGAILWTTSGGEPLPDVYRPDGPFFAATLSGGIALARYTPAIGQGAIDFYDASGALLSHTIVAQGAYPEGGPHAITVAPDDGTVYAAIDNTVDGPDSCQIQAFSPMGVAGAVVGPANGWHALYCNLAVSPHRFVLGGGDGEYSSTFDSLDRSTLAQLVHHIEDYEMGGEISPLTRQVAAAPDDTTAFQTCPHHPTASSQGDGYGIGLWRWDASSALQWQFSAPAYGASGLWQFIIGFWVRDLAIAPDHHIAVGGRFMKTVNTAYPVMVYP